MSNPLLLCVAHWQVCYIDFVLHPGFTNGFEKPGKRKLSLLLRLMYRVVEAVVVGRSEGEHVGDGEKKRKEGDE